MTQERDYNYITSIAVEDGKLLLFRSMALASDAVSLDVKPFLLSEYMDIPEAEAIENLTGNNPLCFKAVFSDCPSYERAVEALKNSSGVRLFKNYSQMAYLDAGIRLFGGMEFPDIRRMQISVLTDEKKHLCGVQIGGCGSVEELFTGTSREVVEFFISETITRDPDVIEGHGLFSRILPLLEKAAAKEKIPFSFGRTDKPAVFSNSRFTCAEKSISFRRCDVSGRHLVDTEYLAMLYDVRTRELESYSIEHIAKHLGLDNEVPEVELTEKLASLWLPAFFYSTKMLPVSLQDAVLRGNGSNLDLLFISEYLKRRASIPYAQAGRGFQGALSRAEKSGVFKNVRHCDVRSLYPSVISVYDMAPASDEERVFPALLREFLRFRVEAKERSRKAETAGERLNAQQLHSAYKILINSFYGYLGFTQGTFNDFDLAEKVTATGRNILNTMYDKLNSCGAEVIEMDTDGIYFVSPRNISRQELEEQLRSVLDEGIFLEFDADYPAMFSYKSKNYALLTADNEVRLTGSALRSRSIELFKRRYIGTVCRELLNGTPENIRKFYNELYNAISEGKIALHELTSSEVLSDSTSNYKRKLASGKGRRSAAYEAVIAAGLELKSGVTVRYYVTGDKKKVTVADNCCLYTSEDVVRNENRAYYCAKLEELAENFRPFINGENTK